jgi:xylan 1,4-beta-xylosidase
MKQLTRRQLLIGGAGIAGVGTLQKEARALQASLASAVSTPPGYPAGSGISGPGRQYDPAAPLEFHRGATGSAVKDGLLPPITPIWDLHLRDTVICLGGDGNYYMTGSSGADIWDHNDGVELWRSTDLRKWDYLGLVWDTHRDGTWEKKPQDLHGKPVVTIWAPEIHYVKKNYFIVLSMAPGGICWKLHRLSPCAAR